MQATRELEFTGVKTSPKRVYFVDDHGSPLDRISALEDTVLRLKNAVVSSEERNIELSRKLRESSLSIAESHVSTESFHHDICPSDCQSDGYQKVNPNVVSAKDGDRYTTGHTNSNMSQSATMEGEKLHLEKKLRKTEEYCRECGRQLKKVLRKYEDLKARNKLLDKQTKQLLAENQRLVEMLKSSYGIQVESKSTSMTVMDDIKEVSKIKVLKERLRSRSRQEIQSGSDGLVQESSMTEEIQWALADCLNKNHKTMTDRVTGLLEENNSLRDMLLQSEQKCENVDQLLSDLREEHIVLESCVTTLQTEKELLQQEVSVIHKEYMQLSKSISAQMQRKAGASPKRDAAAKPESPVHGPIDQGSIDQIWRRLDDGESRRACSMSEKWINGHLQGVSRDTAAS